MAHTFRNLGFETQGLAPGTADGWQPIQLVTGEKFAEYKPINPSGDTFEEFEAAWGNDDFKLVFEGLLIDLTPAPYHSGGQDTEDFEQEWSSVELYDFSPDPVETAMYGSDEFDSFEGWETDILNFGFLEIVGSEVGAISFLDSPDSISIVGYHFGDNGWPDAGNANMRLSDGTTSGANNGPIGIDAVAGNGDLLMDSAVVVESGTALTRIAFNLCNAAFDSVATQFVEDFDGTWTSMTTF